jgi:hypothetical protein
MNVPEIPRMLAEGVWIRHVLRSRVTTVSDRYLDRPPETPRSLASYRTAIDILFRARIPEMKAHGRQNSEKFCHVHKFCTARCARRERTRPESPSAPASLFGSGILDFRRTHEFVSWHPVKCAWKMGEIWPGGMGFSRAFGNAGTSRGRQTREKNVKEFGLGAICRERKQMSRFEVSRWNYGASMELMQA